MKVHGVPNGAVTAVDGRTWEQRRDDLIVVSVWLLMLSYALVSNILILIGIVRSNTMRTATSYWFIISLALCDIVMTIISLVHLVPATAFHNAYVKFHSARNVLMIFFYDLFWYKYVDMSVNSLSLVLMIMSYAVIIYKVRESGKAMAKYQLTIRTRLLFQQQAQAMNGSGSCSRSCSVRPPRSQVSKKEMRLFIQFFVVSLVFLLTWTTWQWLPHMSESKWAYFVMTSLFFINNSVNPTVYLLFNTQLRRELHYLLCRQSTVTNTANRRKHTQMNRDGITNNNDPTTTANGGSCGLAVAAHDISLGHNQPSSHSSGSVDYNWERFHKRFLIKNGHASLLSPVDISEV
ncbi:hypothetical protein QR680_001942 [Steinernema hermaphroditum]|uniref:G-protein coupled receptors family 1 profile domain-containing protein n=1 Tax=Steinernema hermaphroditum TaxID=289476 RepID=A0AA39H2M9_9BILA|nr:hypothetical protein QR680_001942 [Steinernema hermaphroditum]